ncbi:MAG TPA: hypothetical protein VLT47_14275 [Anaeromyxobacteraceae bacterium]|nr:hypothetical protein [Anaeromyxobacteraceae bacterium]
MSRASVVVVVLLLAAGCTSIKTVPEAELAALGGKGLEQVEAARKEEAAARQALAERRAEEKAAEREVRISEAAIERDEAALVIAQLRFEAIQETHDADQMLPANARRAQAEHDLATSKAERTFREAAYDHARARSAEADAAVRVAVASGERAKLEAVHGGRDPLSPEQLKRRAAFEEQVAGAKASLTEADARVRQAKAGMDSAESAWKAIASQKP